MNFENIFSRRNYILLRELVITDFKLRYQGSALGHVWSVLKPLFLFSILYVVFEKFLRIGKDVEFFSVYLLLGVVLWGFFVEATTQGLQSIVSRGDLIRKINFPKYIIVISGTVSALINLFINLIVVILFAVMNGVSFSWSALFAPLLMLELYVLSLSVAFLLSVINVRYRDVGYLWEVFLQAAFYATPIIYPIGMVLSQSELAAKIIMLNPVSQIIQDLRHVLITPSTITLGDLVGAMYQPLPYILIIVIAILASMIFKRGQGRFAEYV